MKFEHQRHKPPLDLSVPRELVVACQQMNSGINASRIVRAAGCLGIRSVILAGNRKLDHNITRDAIEFVEVRVVRTLAPALKKSQDIGYQLVGLEQTTNSTSIFDFSFPRKSVLIIGHERTGIEDEILGLVDSVVEIPVFGLPHSFNAATSATIAMYEYCRQFSTG